MFLFVKDNLQLILVAFLPPSVIIYNHEQTRKAPEKIPIHAS